MSKYNIVGEAGKGDITLLLNLSDMFVAKIKLIATTHLKEHNGINVIKLSQSLASVCNNDNEFAYSMIYVGRLKSIISDSNALTAHKLIDVIIKL